MEISRTSPQGYLVAIPNTSATINNNSLRPALVQDRDTVTLSSKINKTPPKIGFFRLATSRLTKKQIALINQSGQLPSNAKLFYTPNKKHLFRIGNKMFNIKTGLQKLPLGYELKNNWLGFTKLVPEGVEGLFI